MKCTVSWLQQFTSTEGFTPAQLADRLITSLFEDQSIEDAWSIEVERRIKDIESGRSKLIPASEAIAHARAAIK